MIERDAHAKLAQRFQRLQFGGAFADDVAIADFELDTAGIDRRIL